ncbi:hypothetical protein PMSD_10330 [Paenibacillus macquariensis subsp. defensor]|nr:hypothetical protein PMSD_10330 [Paenibacillus macquariensis subsp. defensor]
MFKLFRMEMNLCLRRLEFKAIFFLFFILSVGSFFIACYHSYGADLSTIRSGYEMSLLQGTATKIILSIELMLLPLLAPIIYSDSLRNDIHSGVYKNMLTRTSIRSYVWAKSIVIFIITFFTLFIPLLLNQLLCLIAFPKVGYDNRFAFPPYDIGVQNYDSQAIFDLLRLHNPLLYNLTFMLLISLTGSLFALFAYGVFLLFNKSRFILFTGIFLLITIINLVVTLVGSYRWGLTHLLTPTNKGNITNLLLWFLFLFICGVLAIISTTKQKEIGIGK